MKRIVCFFLLFSLFGSAFAQGSRVRLISATRMVVDQRYDTCVDAKVADIMQSYKSQLDQIVTRVIGSSVRSMTAKAPESLLSNFLSDQLFLKAKEFSPEGVDFAVLNFGGIRASLPLGPLTVGDIYRIMPFENELVVLELKAEDVLSVLQNIAQKGGEGVSNIILTIRHDQIDTLLIGGEPLDNTRHYRVATMDYLADGNGGFTAFRHAVKRVDTHWKVRDVYLSQIEKLTAEGKKVDATMDGRVKLLPN
jgi:2',3'-cyclic-nucleotide 2'-phosphodiesterase (5'-nucleotidase family)